mmetsp:Transcript_9367/g.16595  ORF Transcript_9367/g.16595 Transcript_9367/m.16595 type:complete len:449 (-) Transcript_9367:37-1383(-)
MTAFVPSLGPARGPLHTFPAAELQAAWPAALPSREPRWIFQSEATFATATAAAASVFVRRLRQKSRKAASWRVIRFADQDKGGDTQTFGVAFPFSAVVGQEQIKLALLLNLVDPVIGGVMISGERGTGKSTAVRGVVRLLPDITVVEGDKYNSHPSDISLQSDEVQTKVAAGEKLELIERRTPFVELPLGATEDRVTGTIDIERALKEAGKAFEPGILARVNRGILYIDECNLLDDQLVDVLLDSAAGGVNTVEREGVSVRHPARFILVGTSHPDEGDLRPQLLDRFGLTCDIRTANDAGWRIEVLKRSYQWSKEPEKVEAKFGKQDLALKDLILKARERLPSVKMPRELAVKVSTVCSMLNIDGLRGDIVTNRTAKALAALEGREEVNEEDIRRVAVLCLQHRLRKDVVSDSVNNSGRVVQALRAQFGDGPPPMRPVAELVQKPVSA